MIYYEILNADDSILRRKNMPAGFDPADVAHKFGAGFDSRIVPLVKLAAPPLDPATELLGGEIMTVEADRVTSQLEKITKTAEQLAVEVVEADRQTDITGIKAVAIALKNGVGEPGVRLQRLERVVFRILKDTYGDSV